MPLTFFYSEYEGNKTSPQAYVKEAVRRQWELNYLCRRNTAQAQMRHRKKYDDKILQAKPYAVGHHTSRRDKEATEEMERAVFDSGSAPAGSVLSLTTKI